MGTSWTGERPAAARGQIGGRDQARSRPGMGPVLAARGRCRWLGPSLRGVRGRVLEGLDEVPCYHARLMIFALDLEGVLAPEIWPILGSHFDIPELSLTTRDMADFSELMHL